MAERATISHHFEEELELSERGARSGARFSLIAENVAEAPAASEIQEAWMKSEGHRENLLDPKVNSVGIAVVVRHGQVYAVEDFAHVTPALAIDQQEAMVAGLMKPAGLRVHAGSDDARRLCGSDTGHDGASNPEFVMRYTATTLDRLPEKLLGLLAGGRYHFAEVGACEDRESYPFTGFRLAVLLYR